MVQNGLSLAANGKQNESDPDKAKSYGMPPCEGFMKPNYGEYQINAWTQVLEKPQNG
jgi:hypothetical protein